MKRWQDKTGDIGIKAGKPDKGGNERDVLYRVYIGEREQKPISAQYA